MISESRSITKTSALNNFLSTPNKTKSFAIILIYFFFTQVAKWQINNSILLTLTLATLLFSPLLSRPAFSQWSSESRFPQSGPGKVLTVSYVTTGILCCLALSKQFPFNVWEKANNLNSVDIFHLFLVATIVPISEECFFRLFVYRLQNLNTDLTGPKRTFWSNLPLFYVNSLVFWLFHLPADVSILRLSFENGSIPMPLGPFVLGFFCVIIRHYDGSIFWAIVLHAIANLSAPFWSDALTQMGIFDLFYYN